MRKIKFIFILILVVAIIVAGLYALGRLRSYTDYTVQSSSEHIDAKSTQYRAAGDYLVKFGNDGITCVDSTDRKIWNQSYEMDNPMITTAGEYVAVGDENGRQIYIFNAVGFTGKVDTIYNLLQLQIAENGNTAAVLEDGGIYYLALYDSKGNEIAKGTIHLENSGYPLSMAVSPDGQKLAVAFLNLTSGKANTQICVYNFSSVGRNEIDNIVTSDTYEDLIVARVAYVEENTFVAFGTDHILIYGGKQRPTLEKTIELSEEVASIFYGDGIFGIVTQNRRVFASGDSENNFNYYITAYQKSGRELFTKGFDMSYNDIYVLDNGEVCIQNEHACHIFGRHGIVRLDYEFEDSLKRIRSVGHFQDYDIVFETHTDRVRLS